MKIQTMVNFQEYSDTNPNVRFKKPSQIGYRAGKKSIELTGKREVIEKNYI
nr:hypothetical protein [uncultured bacterium]